MNKWIALIEEYRLHEYATSVIRLYNLYDKHRGFNDELFYEAMQRARAWSEDEEEFFVALVGEIVEGLQVGRAAATQPGLADNFIT